MSQRVGRLSKHALEGGEESSANPALLCCFPCGIAWCAFREFRDTSVFELVSGKCWKCCCPPCVVYKAEGCGLSCMLASILGPCFTMFCWRTPAPESVTVYGAGTAVSNGNNTEGPTSYKRQFESENGECELSFDRHGGEGSWRITQRLSAEALARAKGYEEYRRNLLYFNRSQNMFEVPQTGWLAQEYAEAFPGAGMVGGDLPAPSIAMRQAPSGPKPPREVNADARTEGGQC